MNFTPSDEQINVYRRIEAPTISETISKQTPLGIICILRACADDARAPGPYPNVRNIKPIDGDRLCEFLNAVADRIECWIGLRKEGGAA
jgi:hypothetical protein